MKNYKYGDIRPEDGYVFVGYGRNGNPDFRNPKSFKRNYERRNSNKVYMKQELKRLSQSPEDFLGRWLTKSKYESRNGLKAPIANDITKEWLSKIWSRVNGKCAHTKKKMTYIRGKGKVETNVAVGRKNINKPYTRENIVLIQHKYYRHYN